MFLCLLLVNDFEDTQALADYLIYLDSNDTAYLEYLDWHDDGYSDHFKVSAVDKKNFLFLQFIVPF